MSIGPRLRVGLAGSACVVATFALRPLASQGEQDVVAQARAIHERVITLDTHNDINPSNFTPDCNYTMRLTNQVNLPKMKEGGFDVSFMTVYAEPDQSPDACTAPRYEGADKASIAPVPPIHRLTEHIAPHDSA